MPRNTSILLAFVFLLSVITLFVLNKDKKKGTISSEESLFAIADSGSVNKITIQKTGYKPVILSFDQQWTVNNLFEADYQKVTNLLNFVYKAQIKRPVYKEMVPFVNQEISRNGISVSVFKDDVLLKKYKISFDSTDPSSINAVMDGFNLPYTLQVAGFNENAGKQFSVYPEAWRSKILFNSTIGSIKRLRIEFMRSPDYNFNIIQEIGKYKVIEVPNADSLRLYSYLKLFENVSIREYLPETFKAVKDSLMKITPGFAIEINDKMPGKSGEIKIFYSEGQRGKIYAFVGKANDLVLINPGIFEYLLQKRDFFEPKKQNQKL